MTLEHDTSDETGHECWCAPEVVQPCPECLDEHPKPSCWRCQGRGLVPAFDPEGTVLVIHNSGEEILQAIEGGGP